MFVYLYLDSLIKLLGTVMFITMLTCGEMDTGSTGTLTEYIDRTRLFRSYILNVCLFKLNVVCQKFHIYLKVFHAIFVNQLLNSGIF